MTGLLTVFLTGLFDPTVVPAYREQRMQFILEVKDRMRKYEIKMQGKPLEDIVIRQWTQEKDSREDLTGIYRLFIAVMKDEESEAIPKGLFQKIAHLFYDSTIDLGFVSE